MNSSFMAGNKKKSISVIIADLDTEYIDDIERHYNKYENLIHIEKKVSSLAEFSFALEKTRADVLLVNLDFLLESKKESIPLQESKFSKVIIITDNLELMGREQFPFFESVEWLYKYAPMSLMSERIFTFLPEKSYPAAEVVETNLSSTFKHIMFYSPKGGVGKTTIALNTACQLALKGKRVLLIDFAIFGNIAPMLSLPKSAGLTKAISYLEQEKNYSKEKLITFLREGIEEVNFQNDKLSVLTAASYLKMSNLDLENTDAILSAVEELGFEMIVIDTSCDVSPKNISLFSWANELFFISTTDVVASWSLLFGNELIKSVNNNSLKQYLILNRFDTTTGISSKEIEEVLSMKVVEIIPDMYEQIQGFVNKGSIIAQKPYLKPNAYFRRVAHLICPIFSDKELGKKQAFSLLGGKKSANRRSY